MDTSVRVLVVDDYELIRKIHIKNLHRLGITKIDQAENGQETIDLVEKNHYDLILLDWHMPEMNGLEALKIIRENGNSTPIILCTDEKEIESIQLAEEIGATDYMTKPYTPSEFRSTISSVLGDKLAIE